MRKIYLSCLACLTLSVLQAQIVEEVTEYQPVFLLGSAELNGKLVYFGSNTATNESGIIITDGTEIGTTHLHIPEIESEYSKDFIVYNNKVYFNAKGLDDRELWVTDGTVAGTHIVKDINPIGASNPNDFTICNGLLFFKAYNEDYGSEIWRTDGTITGTVLVKDINPGTGSAELSDLTAFNNELFFSAVGELWKSDGTSLGTQMVKDINPSGNSSPNDFFVHQGKLYFTANLPSHGRELYVSDGTEQGTYLLADLNLGTTSSYPKNFFSVGDNLFFSAESAPAGNELFWYNTQSGNVNMYDFNSQGSSFPIPVGLVNNILLITAITEQNYHRLFTLNMSSGIVDELLALELDYTIDGDLMIPKVLANELYFCANDGTNGRELWASNGTAAGTHKISTFAADLGDPLRYAESLVPFNNALYFTGIYSDFGTALCKVYDPSASLNENQVNSFTIYPNPANEILTIECQMNQTIEIIDIIGNIVYEQQLNQGIQQINVARFDAGTYFVRGRNSTNSTKIFIHK